jgi:pimeloyl-ACP methyl ester carboxylesterase
MASGDLHVERRGEGRAIVLAHGFGGSARNWRPQARAFSSDHAVVTYDARGHARSSAPDTAAAYTLDAVVADLESVAAGSGDPCPVVGGLSMGAAVALHYALAQPERVCGLVLASLPAGPSSRRGIAASAEAFAGAIDEDGLEAAGERFAWGPGSGLDPAGAALVRQGFLEHPPHGLAHTLRELLARLPAWSELPLAELERAVLVVAGEKDTASLAACQEVADRLPDAELVVIPGAGHVVNLAARTEFNAVVGDFLDRLPSA